MKNALLKLLILFFALNYTSAQIFSWKNPNIKSDSISKDSIIARKITKDLFHKDTLDFVKNQQHRVVEEAVKVKPNRSTILGDLTSKGSIIRGITFGNNQGSSVQSTMDLQVSGKLSKDVTILASISDHNLPIQADGYTQTLDEFDKIYIQLNIKNNSILRAGHIDLMDESTFLENFKEEVWDFNLKRL